MSSGTQEPAVHRSYLYVVATREDHIAKAYTTEADAILLELEDAVPPAQKAAGRAAIVELLSSPPPKPTFVRINPLGSGFTLDDLHAVAPLPVAGLRVAKVETAGDVAVLGRWLDELGSDAALHLLLESAAAVEQAPDLLRAHPRVAGAGLGEQDLAADVGMTDDAGLGYARARLVFAARAAGCPPPFQSVWTDLSDVEGLRASSQRGRALGFFGRSAIHPSQVPVINEVFTPTDEEVAEARELERLLAEGVDAGAGGLRLPDGRFVDTAVVRRARRTLAFGARAEAG